MGGGSGDALFDLYRPRLAPLIDLDQLTMADAHLRRVERDLAAAFHLFFRDNLFGGGYAVARGIDAAVECVAALRFEGADLEYLAGLRDGRGEPLIGDAFLCFLADFRFRGDLDAVREGTRTVDPSQRERVWTFEDRMWAVAVPDPERPGELAFDVTPQAEVALGRLEAAGCRRLRSSDPRPEPRAAGS